MQTIPDPSELLEAVCTIAWRAGESIMTIYRRMKNGDFGLQGLPVALKDDDSPLTQADQAAHQVIAQELRTLDPAIAVVSEEDPASHALRSPQGTFWLVDPLDGTKEFVAGSDEFTVNIALVRDGISVMGVVCAPALGELYAGVIGQGAFRIRKSLKSPVHASASLAAGEAVRVLASKRHMNEATRGFIERLGEHRLIQAGSSLKFCRIAEGAADVYPRMGPTCEWDTAAAQAVVEAAGGHVTRLDGTRLTYGKPSVLNPDFVVSNLPLHRLPGYRPGT